MIGRRTEVPDGLPKPGDYYKLPGGEWHACTPNDHLANLAAHVVVEHADGTITVSPSIAVGRHANEEGKLIAPLLYHGFLKEGVWSSAGDDASWETLPVAVASPKEGE
jgi:hypothetical protein